MYKSVCEYCNRKITLKHDVFMFMNITFCSNKCRELYVQCMESRRKRRSSCLNLFDIYT